MKKIFFILLLTIMSCEFKKSKNKIKDNWIPVIVKGKYTENETTKDLFFNTGNWHSVNRIIVDINDKIWENTSKEVFIVCNVGDTLWVENESYGQLQLNKQNKF